MTTVGWAGLGRLGLPCALALASRARVTVIGHDRSDWAARVLTGEIPVGDDLADALARAHAGAVLTGSLADMVAATDRIVFVAVQTPHDPGYGGDRPAPAEPADFDYSALTQSVREIAAEATTQGKQVIIVVISTVLPGTTRARLLPLLAGGCSLVYGPYFTAMGTTASDFLDPEFQLLGGEPAAAAEVAKLYAAVHDRPVRLVSVESAELAKVAYNTLISLKIVFANMLGELCEATGADADEVTGTLALATRRITSGAYLRAGMGDGGPCHPRDLMALSWLSRRLGVSANVAGFVAAAREAQSARLAALVTRYAELSGLPVLILGRAYKPGVALTDGSPALLLAAQLEAADVKFTQWDPLCDDGPVPLGGPAVIVAATAHDELASLTLPQGSVVIDPSGCLPASPGVTMIYPGRRR